MSVRCDIHCIENVTVGCDIHYIENVTVGCDIHYIENVAVRYDIHYIKSATVRYDVYSIIKKICPLTRADLSFVSHVKSVLSVYVRKRFLIASFSLKLESILGLKSEPI